MPGLVVDAIAKRDAQLPYVRIFLSISDGARGVPDLTTDQIEIETVETGSPLAVAAIYPEAFLPGKYIAVVKPAEGAQPNNAVLHHDGRLTFRINVRTPAPGQRGTGSSGTEHGYGQTVVYLPSRNED